MLQPGRAWHPDYQPQCSGDLRARDELQPILKSLGPHLAGACIGSISEIFDAEAPCTPRGCCAQAWSLAEALRVLTAINASRQQATTEKVAQRTADPDVAAEPTARRSGT